MAAASTTAGPVPARRRSRGISERRLANLMVTPSLLLIALVALYPVIYGVWVSMHQYSLITAGLSRWASTAGLGNYKEALQSSEFWDATRVTLIFTVAPVVLETILGLPMALILNQAFRVQGVVRTV